MLELLSTLLLAVHLLAMNLACAGPLVSAWLRWSNAEPGGLRLSLGRRLVQYSVLAFLAGMIAGGLLLLTTPGEGLSLALRRFPARAYWFAGAELIFSLVCMTVIAIGWKKIGRWGTALLAFASATNLLYHFPPFMAVIGQLAADPHWTSETVIDRPALLKLMTHGEVLALTFHFGMSSLAVAGIAVLQLLSWEAAERDNLESRSLARGSAAIALSATIMQIPIGVWLLINLPTAARNSLMGSSVLASIMFIGAIVTSLGLMQSLVMVVLGETDRQNLQRVVSRLIGVVLLMTFSLRLSRPVSAVPAAETKTASNQSARSCIDYSI